MRSASPKTATKGMDIGLKLLLWPLLAAIVFSLIGFGEVLEDGLRIGRNALHSQKVSGDIVMVEVDDASLSKIGSWPWPRSTQATLIKKSTSLAPARSSWTSSTPRRARRPKTRTWPRPSRRPAMSLWRSRTGPATSRASRMR